MRTRRTLLATGLVALLSIAGLGAAVANDPPPRIAFLANGIVPADALAAGPIAGQLGAPMYTTRQEVLSDAAAAGLANYDPDLVIVLGGPVAIADAVIGQVEDATGLAHTDKATPAGGIVRAAGGDRFDTAAAVADLLNAYNPAYLPVDMKSSDSDRLDGMDSTDFVKATDAIDASTVTGLSATELQIPTVVPAGRMLTGMHAQGSSAAASGERTETYVSFPFPLAADPSDIHVMVNGGAAPECPGSITAPSAEPGHLCVWIDTYGFNTPTASCVGGVNGGAANCNGTDGAKDGFIIVLNATGAGSYGQRGTWAVTAPAADAVPTTAGQTRGGDFDEETETVR